ncbi:MAG: cyclase family protein [Caldilineaceae bacterium]
MLYDITRCVTPSMAVWPGDTAFAQRWVSRMEEGASCNVSAMTLSPHTGTHADAPLHYNVAGLALAELPLDVFIGPALVVELDVRGEVRREHLEGIALRGVPRLLIKTHASSRADNEWRDEFPFLSVEAVAWMAEQGVRLFGTDAPSVDFVTSKTLDAHHALDRANIFILENLQLGSVAPGLYELIAPPLKVMLDGSPIRALLRSLPA